MTKDSGPSNTGRDQSSVPGKGMSLGARMGFAIGAGRVRRAAGTWLLGLVVLMAASDVGAQVTRTAPTSIDFAATIDSARSIVKTVMEDANVPGASIAISVGDQIIWSEGFGFADMENRTPVTTVTKFRAGSVSKTMTASALGLLIDRGLLHPDSLVQAYVPDFPEKRWPITVRQIAGHMAGIRHYRGNEMLSSIRYPTVESGLVIFQDDSLLFQPGTAYRYSSYGWNLVSAVIEGASQSEFLGFMQRRVFAPLGLRHTAADYTDHIVPLRTSFYDQDDAGAIINAPFVDNSYKWAGGGFLSTPEDLVRFAEAHEQAGFLSESTLALLQSPQHLASGETTNYGMGWATWVAENGTRHIGHSGGSVGGTTLLLLSPEHDLVVAGMVNLSGGPSGRMVREIAALFEDKIESLR
jgi:serine beta-lactamase-like protein LACTB, mitochondrial